VISSLEPSNTVCSRQRPVPTEAAAAETWSLAGRHEHGNGWIAELTDTLEQVRALVARREVRVSVHGYEELAVEARDVTNGLERAEVVEDYPDYHKGPCVRSSSGMAGINRFMYSGVFPPV